MGPLGSTLKGPNGEAVRLHQLARVLGNQPPDELTALLLPMVRRSLRTARGPQGLVRWLRDGGAARRAAPPEPTTRRLTEKLVRDLFDPPATFGGTLTDSRVHEGKAPAAS